MCVPVAVWSLSCGMYMNLPQSRCPTNCVWLVTVFRFLTFFACFVLCFREFMWVCASRYALHVGGRPLAVLGEDWLRRKLCSNMFQFVILIHGVWSDMVYSILPECRFMMFHGISMDEIHEIVEHCSTVYLMILFYFVVHRSASSRHSKDGGSLARCPARRFSAVLLHRFMACTVSEMHCWTCMVDIWWYLMIPVGRLNTSHLFSEFPETPPSPCAKLASFTSPSRGRATVKPLRSVKPLGIYHYTWQMMVGRWMINDYIYKILLRYYKVFKCSQMLSSNHMFPGKSRALRRPADCEHQKVWAAGPVCHIIDEVPRFSLVGFQKTTRVT
jgi:hypothetical protein